MARKAVKKLQDALHPKGGQTNATQESSVETQGSLQGASRGRTSKRRFLSSLGHMRELFTPSRSPSRNPGIEGHATESTQALDKAAQQALSGPMISETGLTQSQEPHQRIDIGTPGISTPDIRISASDGAKNEPIGLAADTKLTEHGGEPTTGVHSSDIPQDLSDIALIGSQNNNPSKVDDVKKVKEDLENAQVTVQQMKDISNAEKANTILNMGNSTVDQLDTVTACLRPLKEFNSVVNTIANVQTVLSQTDRDQSINDLLLQISHVYSFIIENETLANINRIREPLLKIGELVRKGVQFIQNYAEVKSFWGRLCKNAFTETDSVIAAYRKNLETLTQQCRDIIAKHMGDN
ncbi:hypothetical protein ID866_11959, partial [Astraeus odoratus]